MLTIAGERRFEKERKQEKNFHSIKRFYGHFTRSFNLRFNIKDADIKGDSNKVCCK
ncbi:MAG: HSP20 family molecular chaperone IbpA [Cellvibrionaceae bacterium]|jgi:HSP20 family molecular chaperone IbpA